MCHLAIALDIIARHHGKRHGVCSAPGNQTCGDKAIEGAQLIGLASLQVSDIGSYLWVVKVEFTAHVVKVIPSLGNG